MARTSKIPTIEHYISIRDLSFIKEEAKKKVRKYIDEGCQKSMRNVLLD
jgi:hypothetical protein